jgi:hypothetical protein
MHPFLSNELSRSHQDDLRREAAPPRRRVLRSSRRAEIWIALMCAMRR